MTPPLTEEQRRLVEEYLPLAMYHAGKFMLWAPRQEARDLMLDALVYAVRTHDASRGTTLKTWVIDNCHWYRVRWVRQRQEWFERTQELRQPLYMQETVIDPLDDIAAIDARLDAETMLDSLDFRSRDVVEGRANGDTLQDVASVFNVSRERVRQIEERAITKLRERYDHHGKTPGRLGTEKTGRATRTTRQQVPEVPRDFQSTV